ncbi:MAG: Holliday junction branch migration protein RuvA [Paludibacteraceae bacterium]|nr:Holliday junction branch migration protein RuvA [Paludibacteraceae bacterium]
MIDYVKGEIASLTPTLCVLETCGVGFGINITLTAYQQLQSQTSARLYVYESIKEDAFQLFGFITPEERETFLLLISVSGVGAGTARMILSTYSAEELIRIISSGDVNSIKRVKGIGLKTAQRIIVDLKDKMNSVGASDVSIPLAGGGNEKADEAISALVALGFQQAASAKVVNAIIAKDSSLSTGAIIKQALKQL